MVAKVIKLFFSFTSVFCNYKGCQSKSIEDGLSQVVVGTVDRWIQGGPKQPKQLWAHHFYLLSNSRNILK